MITADWSLHAFAATLTIALASTNVVGGAGTTATITLASAAPPGGTIVTVASAPPVRVSGGSNQVSLVGQIGPMSIRIPQGATQVTIDVFTTGVAAPTTSTITAKSGTDSSVASLTIRPASIVSMSLSPTTVTGGQSTSLHIVLDGAAPSGTGIDAPLIVSQIGGLADGSVRTIAPSLPSSVNAPATVHFPPGSSDAQSCRCRRIPCCTTSRSRSPSNWEGRSAPDSQSEHPSFRASRCNPVWWSPAARRRRSSR